MFSSSGSVKQSHEFNPAPSDSSKVNFCMLGEEVEKVPFPPSHITKRDSGTSIATSIWGSHWAASHRLFTTAGLSSTYSQLGGVEDHSWDVGGLPGNGPWRKGR
jgi:hypothetical protein